MQPGLLPLFPLQAVLLPGADLPLHIFEDRYKEMIGEVIRERIEFGVVLANDKGIVNTGCTAVIEKVLREYEDGRMDILARGRRRFEIVMLNDERSFLRGTVEFFDDDESEPASADLQQRAINGYNEIQALSKHEPFDTSAPFDTSGPLNTSEPLNISGARWSQLSFRLAQPVPDVTFRQLLLSTRSEAERLRQIADFLPSYLIRQRRIQHVKDVAPRNGHGHSLAGIE